MSDKNLNPIILFQNWYEIASEKEINDPNAVAVANIITEKMMKGNSKTEKIILDTEAAAGIGSMTSTVEIILNKI